MKKLLLLMMFVTGMVAISMTGANAQCTTAPNGQWPTGNVTPSCFGIVQPIVSNAYTGEYSVMALTAGNTYTFSSSVLTDYITITNSAGTTSLVWGTTPVSFTPGTSGTYRFYRHNSSACGATAVNRTIYVLTGTQLNPNQYGNGSWIGHVYATHSGTSPANAFTTTYLGQVYESDIFTRDYGTGGPTGGNVCNGPWTEDFAIRYLMTRNFSGGVYTFTVTSDDGARLWIDGVPYINQWIDQGPTPVSVTVYLTAGNHSFVYEYYENGGGAYVAFNIAEQRVGYTGYSGTNAPALAAGSCTGNSGTWCAGSGTYSDIPSLVSGVNYTVEKIAGTSGCSNSPAAMGDAYLQVWPGSASCTTPNSVIGLNSVSFNATSATHNVHLTQGFTANNTTCSGLQGWSGNTSAVLRYRQNTTVSVNPSVPGNLCNNGTKTITATLGGTHNNPTINWSKTGPGTLSASTGSSINYTADGGTGSVTITATVGVCSATHTFTVNASPTINAGSPVANICQGGTTAGLGFSFGGGATGITLSTLTGGSFSNVNDPNSTWTPPAGFSGTATINAITSGGSCGTANTSKTVTVQPTPAAGSVTASQTVCQGSVPNLLNLSGQVVGSTVSDWQSSPDGITWTSFANTTTSYQPSSPPGNMQYRARISYLACSNVNSTPATISVTAPSNVLATDGESRTCRVNGNQDVMFYHPVTRDLILSINANGQDLGDVTATAYVSGSPISVQACNTYQPWYITDALGRRWKVTTTNQPASPVTVKLPFSNAELSSLVTVSNANANPNDDIPAVNSAASLDLSKYNNLTTPALENGSFADNCAPGASATVWTQTANGTLAGYPSASFVQYNIPGFSELWLSGTNNVSPLPITLQSFTATCMDGTVRVDWTTASEINNEQFVIEKSANLQDWEQVTTVQGAGNSNQPLSYSVVDDRPLEGYSYYRLTQYDYDGQNETFEPVAVLCTGTTSITVFPNPTEGIVYVQGSFTGTVSCSLVDATGKPVHQSTIVGTGQMHTYVFDYSNLPAGVYTLQLREVPAVVKVIIAK